MINYFNSYVGFLKKFFDVRRPLKVVFDCSNGTVGLVASKLKIKNLELKIINARPDGNFPAHGPNPMVAGALKQLQKTVLKNKADLGAIFDADGDRVFFVDNHGRLVDSDAIAYLLIWYFNVKKAMVDVRTGWLVKKIVKKELNVKIIESRVGHYFMKKMMRREKLEFGAERSGHYYFNKFFYLDSGLMAAIEVINAVSKLPYSLADFADLLTAFYNAGEVNFKFNGNMKNIIAALRRKYGKAAQRISRLDGITMEFKDRFASRSFALSSETPREKLGEGWWFNIRFSNTEPLLRLNLETQNKDDLQKHFHQIKTLIDSLAH
ncbi:MAG: hypothetical protein AAB772_01995 [Patescibacteria group bacterium]